MVVSIDCNRFFSVVSYFGKRQDEQHRQETSHPAGVREFALELSLCVLHALAELLITSKPEADRGKLEVFVTEPGAIRSVVKFITIDLLEE